MKKLHFLTAVLLFCCGCFTIFSAEKVFASDTVPLTLGVETTAAISIGGEEAMFSFVPEETAVYCFYAISDSDTIGRLYDGDMDELKYDDDSGAGNNFRISYTLYEGETYHFGVGYYDGDMTGTFTVCLDVVQGLQSVSRVSDETLLVNPGESARMEVSAVCNSGELTYSWTHYWTDVQGNDHSETIKSADAPVYVAENITYNGNYCCNVTDQYGNSDSISFDVKIDNNLVVDQGENNGVPLYSVTPGGSAVLEVRASCNEGTLNYRWEHSWYDTEGKWHKETIGGADVPIYVAENLLQRETYYCYVTDEYGNSDFKCFDVEIDNRLTVEVVGNNVFLIAPGDSVTLEVRATCLEGTPTIRWGHEYDGDGHWSEEMFEGAEGPIYVAENILHHDTYVCKVTDEYGNEDHLRFTVTIDNHFTANTVGSDKFIAAEGSDVTMQVEASCTYGDIYYQWYKDAYLIEGATAAAYTTVCDGQASDFTCVIRDDYGSRDPRSFSIIPADSITDLAVGDSAVLSGASGGPAYVRLTPAETGSYRLYSTEKPDDWSRYATYLYDENLQSVTDRYYTGDYVRNVYQLTGGKTYYYSIRWNSSSDLAIHLAKGNGLYAGTDMEPFYAEGSTIFTKYVRRGETAKLEVFAGCDEGEVSYQWYDSDDNAIPGADASCYIVENVREDDNYTCLVQDETGDFIQVPIMLFLSSFSINAVTEERLLAADGEPVFMKVSTDDALGDLTYAWYYSPDFSGSGQRTQIEEAEEDSYGFTYDSSKTGCYICQVTEGSGTSQELIFTVQEKQEPVPLIPEQETVAVINRLGDFATYVFNPVETGVYHFASTSYIDNYYSVMLYDTAWNPLLDKDLLDYYYRLEGNFNFHLTGGETYYCVVRFDSYYETGNIPFKVSKWEENNEKTVILTAGRTDVMAGETYFLNVRGDDGNRTELWASDGTETWLVKIIERFGDSRVASDSRDTGGEITYFAREYFDDCYAESNPVTITVTAPQGTLDAPDLQVSDANGTVSIEVTYPEETETGTVRIWNDSCSRIYEHTGSGTRTETEAVPAGVYKVRVEAKAPGYLSGVKEVTYIVHAAQKLVLPADLDTIEEEAFAGVQAEEIVLQDGCSGIGRRAFADCSGLKLICMPDSVTEIADDAFEGSNATFICASRNAAYAYAVQKNIDCIVE